MTSVLLPSRTPRRAVPSTLLVLATALMLALPLPPPPAHAHDTLIATDPEDGATLETSPEEITLTFSANILDVSPVARISDEDGELLTEITPRVEGPEDRKSTRLNSSHVAISYAVFCLKKKKTSKTLN